MVVLAGAGPGSGPGGIHLQLRPDSLPGPGKLAAASCGLSHYKHRAGGVAADLLGCRTEERSPHPGVAAVAEQLQSSLAEGAYSLLDRKSTRLNSSHGYI